MWAPIRSFHSLIKGKEGAHILVELGHTESVLSLRFLLKGNASLKIDRLGTYRQDNGNQSEGRETTDFLSCLRPVNLIGTL